MAGLEKILGSNPAPEKVAGGFSFTEGPVFSRRGYLLFSDIPANRIMKWTKGRGHRLCARTATARMGLLSTTRAAALLALRKEAALTRTEKDGSITTSSRKKGLTASQRYCLCDRRQHLLLRSPSQRNAAGKSLLYQIKPKGEVRVATEECEGPNGVALSPNQQKLYVADSRARNVRVFDVLQVTDRSRTERSSPI